MFTVLWCYLRNTAFKVDGVDYHDAADLTGQANHMGVTIEADIIKQKLPPRTAATRAELRQDQPAVYSDLSPTTPSTCAVAGGQLLHGQDRLINSGGESKGAPTCRAVRTAVINKRAGGSGLISGRKAFQKRPPRARAAQRRPGRYLDARSPSPDRPSGRHHARAANGRRATRRAGRRRWGRFAVVRYD
jgi:DhnA family fructose-bisphosphate aldolase class Ia